MKLCCVSLLVLILGTSVSACGGDDENTAGSSDDRAAATSSAVDESNGGGAAPEATQTAPALTPQTEPRFSGVKGEVEAVVREEYAAIAAGDGEKVCSLHTKGLQRKLVKHLSSGTPRFQGKTCGEIRTMVIAGYPPEIRRTLVNITIKKVVVKGDKAVVTRQLPLGETDGKVLYTRERLVRVDGVWKVYA